MNALNIIGGACGAVIGYILADAAQKRWPHGARNVTLGFGLILIGMVILTLSGCGALFAPDHVDVDVNAGSNVMVTVDGQPTQSRRLHLTAHERHLVQGTVDGKTIGACDLRPTIQTRYIVGDALLIESVVAIVLDAYTGDWGYIEDDHCDLGGAP